MAQRAVGAAGMHDSGRGRWIGLAMLSLGVAMIIVDATIVNVAVPQIIRDLTLDSTTAEWINTTYALVFAALLITLGRIGDVWGRRRLYLLGLVIFAGASMLAGLAPTGEVLIAARILQGVGGAMILPSTQSILNTNFQGRDRAIAFGIWGAVIGGVAAIGPLLGGWLTTNLSWRWAFFINLPVAILAIAGTLYYIGESKDEDAHAGFDLPGFMLVTLGLGGVVFGLIEGRNYGWWTPNQPFTVLGWTWPLTSVSVIPFAIGLGFLCLVAFAVVETRRRRAGRFFLFDFSLWRYPGFRYGNLAGTIVSLGEFGLLFALPLFLQAVLGYSAFETGLVFLALAIGAFFAAPLAANFARRFGNRWVVTVGMSLEAIGIVITSILLSATVSGFQLAPPLFIYGLGVGFATAQLTSLVLSDVPPQRSGLASGANSTLRQVGSALGIAILGTVLFTTLVNGTSSNLATAVPNVPPVCQDLVTQLVDESAGQILPALKDPTPGAADQSGFAASLTPEQQACFRDPAFLAAIPEMVAPIENAFVDAAKLTGYVATAFVLLGVVFSRLLPAMRPHPVETPVPVVGGAEAAPDEQDRRRERAPTGRPAPETD
jgi:EmrB/QacA subfamily drug resistance transporter